MQEDCGPTADHPAVRALSGCPFVTFVHRAFQAAGSSAAVTELATVESHAAGSTAEVTMATAEALAVQAPQEAGTESDLDCSE